MFIKKGNGRLELCPPQGNGASTQKLGKLKAGTLQDEAINKEQMEDGSLSPTFNNLIVEGTLTASGMTTDSVAPAITAKAGGGQDATLALSKNLNIVTTVATAADSVTLPAAAAGLRITIVNLGANALAVFPYTSDSINDAAADASVTQDPETTVTYNCYTGVLWESDNESLDAFDKIYTGDGTVSLPAFTFAADKDTGWYRVGANNPALAAGGSKVFEGTSTGTVTTGTGETTGVHTFGSGNVYKSLTTQTALAGGAQAGTALTAEYMNFTVVATALDSAQLPTPVLGTRRIVQNSAALPMAVFGQTGASIDGGAANASVVIMPGQTVTFNAISATAWKSNVGNLDKSTLTITQEVTLTATEIVGNSAGDIGHANGAVLIPGVSSAYAMEFVSAVLIYDFATAAYTGGADDLVVCISGGGATLSGATTAANLLGAAGDKIVAIYPLSTAGNPLSVGTGINIKSTAWTQPGTAAGVLRCQVTYRLHVTGL